MKKSLSALTGVLLALSLALAALAALLYAAGTNAPLMHSLFLSHAPAETTGLPDKEYGPVAEMIAAYLVGEKDEFQHRFTAADGTIYLCFNTREQQHMADCAALFRLCHAVQWISGGTMMLLTGAAFLLGLDRQRLLRAFAHTMGALLALVVVIALWACMDFDSLFVLFHRLFFANDLWLLNPATDLLIRLMPTGFFITYAMGVGATWLLLCIACTAIAHMQGRKYAPTQPR